MQQDCASEAFAAASLALCCAPSPRGGGGVNLGRRAGKFFAATASYRLNGARRSLVRPMPVRISDPSLAPDLVEFFRRNAFLAVHETDATIDVLPIRAGSEEADRLRIRRYVEAWLADHPGVVAELVEDDEDGARAAAN